MKKDNPTNVLVELPGVKKAEVVDLIQHIAKENTGAVIFIDHAEMRMLERGASRIQVMRAIQSGHPTTHPTWDTKKENGWKVTFRKRTAGMDIDVGTKLVERQGDKIVLIITTF